MERGNRTLAFQDSTLDSQSRYNNNNWRNNNNRARDDTNSTLHSYNSTNNGSFLNYRNNNNNNNNNFRNYNNNENNNRYYSSSSSPTPRKYYNDNNNNNNNYNNQSNTFSSKLKYSDPNRWKDNYSSSSFKTNYNNNNNHYRYHNNNDAESEDRLFSISSRLERENTTRSYDWRQRNNNYYNYNNYSSGMINSAPRWTDDNNNHNEGSEEEEDEDDSDEEGEELSSSYDSDSDSEETSAEVTATNQTTTAPLIEVRDLDLEPVIPRHLLEETRQVPLQWSRHPCHSFVISLLQHRGIYLPRNRELVDYHMAEYFLHYLSICQRGSYFVYYGAGRWPKERFFSVSLLPLDRTSPVVGELLPHLVMRLHRDGVQIVDAVPLKFLVGVTATAKAACFRPFLETANTIIGCREGRGHRARLPADGAFTLWFYDRDNHRSRSFDLLTCNAKVFDVWTKACRGVVSVNSSCTVQAPLTTQRREEDLQRYTAAAQQQTEEEYRQLQESGKTKGKKK
ncbi:hypothetical protein AGDE_07660 [Angomonas deanei]|nr:hypothetical protein AGDE_07660 [Angomonas deanei]|eukprot:EPY34976.1 hypothetical protein AGDE_07660 [Angomonas deanei]